MSQSKDAADKKILEKAEVIARTVMSQQPFYHSKDCNEHHRQLYETMIGAAIWYLPQGKELWTGEISIAALRKLSETQTISSLTKDHNYPRKVAASELFKVDWSKISIPHQEVLTRYRNKYGLYNYVLPSENKKLVKYQKGHMFTSPAASYQQAAIPLRTLSYDKLNLIRKGDRQLAESIISS